MKKVAVIAVVIAIAIWAKLSNRGEDSTSILGDMKTIIAQTDAYARHGDYLNEMLEREHKLAFDEYYSMGGRRTAASFDEDGYVRHVLDRMIDHCRSDKYEEVAEELAQLKTLLFAADEPV